MYIIRRMNRRFNNKTFTSYEKARSYVRKWLRKHAFQAMFDLSWSEHSNPSINTYGFKIVKVVN